MNGRKMNEGKEITERNKWEERERKQNEGKLIRNE